MDGVNVNKDQSWATEWLPIGPTSGDPALFRLPMIHDISNPPFQTMPQIFRLHSSKFRGPLGHSMLDVLDLGNQTLLLDVERSAVSNVSDAPRRPEPYRTELCQRQ